MKINQRLECWTSGECQRMQDASKTITGKEIPCVNGMAGEYPCQNVDLLAHLNFVDLGCQNSQFALSEGNDIWGWTSPANPEGNAPERFFALVGCTTGTSFVEITDPINPIVIGWLPTPTTASTWRDIKVYKNYAFIVTEARGSGMQVFDLTHLLTTPPSKSNVFKADAWYTDAMGTET